MRTVPYVRRRRRDRSVDRKNGDESLESPRTLKRSSSWKYYDEEGVGPFRRFLRPDNPEVVYPTRRIVLMMFLGSCLSTVGVQLSADEYYEGPQQTFISHYRENKTGYPVHIAFNNVGCSVAGLVDPIISNITGEIRTGKLTGIMGQSGSGKTTFAYSVLGRGKRYCTNGAHGTVYLNGRPRDLEAFLDRVGFVPQDDILYSDLTVEEALTFSASWRLPRDMNSTEKAKVVEDTLKTLDLVKVRNRRIGDSNQRSISGGERKRTSIGMELVSQPAVLVMDEPTSGLDSAGTYRLMKMLKEVADRGVSVVTVIHQPSARVFELLDDVILMQNGEAAYIGEREGVMPFLAEMNYVVPVADVNGNGGSGSCSSRTGSAEYVLDVLARLEQPKGPPLRKDIAGLLCDINGNETDAASFCRSKMDNLTHPLLPSYFRYYQEHEWHTWDGIEQKMEKTRREEDIIRCYTQKAEMEYFKIKDILDDRFAMNEQVDAWKRECERLSPEALQKSVGVDHSKFTMLGSFLGLLGVAQCAESDPRVWCTLFDTHSSYFPSYQQLPKPGLKQQVHLWFWQIMGLKWRRGLLPEIFVIASLALAVSFVRSFNHTWNRRAVSNLFLSISIGLLGMVGAVFNDDIAPVQRAASAGMLLGAHEFAVLAESIVWGWCVCHIYSLFYFFGLWVRTGMWILDPIDTPIKDKKNINYFDFTYWVRLQKYYEWCHILHLNYLASGALGKAICVFANHNSSVSYVAAVATLITCHVFAFFTPNQHQIKEEARIFGSINIAPFVELLCSISYVRYFLEAIFLWDPSPRDKNGRDYVLRYFGYVDANKTHCATSLFSLWTFAQAVRFLVFGFRNSNDFHSLHDTPLFLIFIFKVLSCHVVALLLMTLIQEAYFPWVASLQKKAGNMLEQDVDVTTVTNESRPRHVYASYFSSSDSKQR